MPDCLKGTCPLAIRNVSASSMEAMSLVYQGQRLYSQASKE